MSDTGTASSFSHKIHDPSDAEWIDDAAGLERVIEQVLHEPAYAIDTEFLRERTYFPRLALVQIAWPTGLVLIDPLVVDLAPFRRVLESDVIAVFHAADQDLEVLEYACRTVPRRLFDTQLAAGFVGFSTASLSTLTERIMRVKLSKGDRLTDWTQRPLTTAQKSYAASDVIYLLAMRAEIEAQLDAAGRSAWVEEESELLRTRARGQSYADKAWWRLKDGRVLRGRDRIVAQELCAWRERRAQQDDKPVRFVLPDLAVLSVAQAKPTTFAELAATRGVDGRYLKSGAGNEIIQAIERAVDFPATALQLPEPEDFDKRLRPALTLVSAWVSQLARDAKIDASLLATRSDLISFLRGDADARLSRGWRGALMGDAVRQLVSGEAALAFARDGSLNLEHRSNQPLRVDVAVPTADWVLDAPDPNAA